jgi:hypothetical protein
MARYNQQCKYHVPAASSDSMMAMGSRLSFLIDYLSSGREFCQLYPFWKLPLYYAFGVMYVLLKVLLLNPPFLTRFQSTLRFEVDAGFPGETILDRLAFAKRWYSMEPREPPFLDNVGARFTHLADRNLWMEQMTLGLPPLLSLPAMTVQAIFDGKTGAWFLVGSSFVPHAFCGWVRVGENPDGTGWLIAGELKHWWGLGWFYKWLISQALETYVDECVKCQQKDLGEPVDQ